MINQEDRSAMSAGMTLEERRLFLKLPIEERRRRLAEQAALALSDYEEEAATKERLQWQSGDIVEY